MDYRILGPLEVRAEPGGEPRVLTGRRRRAVLAFLLLYANAVVTKDRIIEAVWAMDWRTTQGDGDEPVTDESAGRGSTSPCPIDASRTLRNIVCDLRKALGDSDHPEILLTCPGGYCLVVHPGELDADRFEDLKDRAQRALEDGHPQDALDALVAAAELWRGDPFGDLAYGFAQPKIKELRQCLADMHLLRGQRTSRRDASQRRSASCRAFSSTPPPTRGWRPCSCSPCTGADARPTRSRSSTMFAPGSTSKGCCPVPRCDDGKSRSSPTIPNSIECRRSPGTGQRC